jgi:hypothetical protein
MDSIEHSGVKRRTVLSAAALAGVTGMSGMTGIPGMSGLAAASPAIATEPATRPRPPLRTVRLTTGDRVFLRDSAIVDVETAGRLPKPPFLRYVIDGDQYVVPAQFLDRIRSGEIDERLFNVTGLARAGIEDAAKADPARISPRRPKRASVAETYEVSVQLWDRLGKNPPADDESGWNRVFFVNADTGEWADATPRHGESVALPAGRYLAVAGISTPEPDADYPSRSMIALPGLNVTADTEVTFDARIGSRVSVTVPDQDAADRLGLVAAVTAVPDPDPHNQFAMVWLDLSRYDDVYVGTPPGAGDPDFIFARRQMLQEPELQVTATTPERFDLKAEWYDAHSPRIVGRQALVAVHVGAATPDDLAGLELTGKLALLDLPPQDGYELVPRLRQLADAGAAAALHVGEAPPFPRYDVLPLPTGFALGSGARRLAELKVGGTVNVNLRGLRVSPFRYDLSFPAREAIPARQDHRLRRRDLAQLRVTYASQGAPALGFTGASAFFYGFGLGAGGGASVPRPTIRDEYVTPGEWELNSVGPVMFEQAWQVRHTYEAGRHYVIEWHKAVLGPAFPPDADDDFYQVVRDGDTISSVLLMFTDGQGNPGELWYPDATDDYTIKGSQELYRDGKLLGRVDDNGMATFVVPPDHGRYELRADILRRAAHWQTATDVSAAWTFESGPAATPALLPLLTIQAVADVDETNATTGDRALLLPLYVHRQDLNGPAPVRRIAVHYSLQDGENWQPAKVIPSGRTEWTARIAKPGKGFLSLRLSASDKDGNTVTQTVIRAIQLR